MMGDCCWTVHSEVLETSHKKTAKYSASPAREKYSTRPLNKIKPENITI
jgi:hypothetical protein